MLLHVFDNSELLALRHFYFKLWILRITLYSNHKMSFYVIVIHDKIPKCCCYWREREREREREGGERERIINQKPFLLWDKKSSLERFLACWLIYLRL